MIIPAMASSVSPTHGEQGGTAYNGHFGCIAATRFSCTAGLAILSGVHYALATAAAPTVGVKTPAPVVERYRKRYLRRHFRGDAAFASPDIYEFPASENFRYAGRLKANKVLQEDIAHLLSRPVGGLANHVRRYHTSA